MSSPKYKQIRKHIQSPSLSKVFCGFQSIKNCFKEYLVHTCNFCSLDRCVSIFLEENHKAPSAPQLGKLSWLDTVLYRNDYLLLTRAGVTEQLPLYSGISLARKVVMHHWCLWCFNSKLHIISNDIIAKGSLG